METKERAQIMRICVHNASYKPSIIEGLHDAVRTYTRTILPRPPGFLFVLHGKEKKQQKTPKLLIFLHRTIQNFNRVYMLIFLSRYYNLVL